MAKQFLLQIISGYSAILSPYHIVIKETYHQLLQLSQQLEENEDSIQNCKEIIKRLKMVYPINHRLVASYQYLLVSLLPKQNEDNKKRKEEEIDSLYQMMSICCGTDHPDIQFLNQGEKEIDK